MCGLTQVDVLLLTSLVIFITTPSLLVFSKASRLGVLMKITNKVSKRTMSCILLYYYNIMHCVLVSTL